MLYPLKFKPLVFEKVWGAGRLSSLYNKDCGSIERCGESWEVSGIKGKPSVIENGFLAGNELSEIVEVYMEDLVGEEVFKKFGDFFPLLVKLIDTDDYLSLQVHPGNNIPQNNGNEHGKAEFWYVLNAEKNAEIIVGLGNDVDKETFVKHIENKTLKSICNVYKVNKGDAFFIPPGTIHAIGSGVTLLEVQQSSDITYRVYDWDRPGLDGKPRKIDIDSALKVMDFSANDNCKIPYRKVINSPVNLADNEYFNINLISFDKKLSVDYFHLKSFVVITCVEGSVTLKYYDGTEKLNIGQSLVLPAEIHEIEFIPEGNATLIETSI